MRAAQQTKKTTQTTTEASLNWIELLGSDLHLDPQSMVLPALAPCKVPFGAGNVTGIDKLFESFENRIFEALFEHPVLLHQAVRPFPGIIA
jgi:hypothetical protein